MGTIEKQIQSLQSELKRVKSDLAARNREIRASRAQPQAMAPSAPVPPQVSLMPAIPPGYALVPASPGSTPGSVVLARAEPPAPALPPGVFKIGKVEVQLGGWVEVTSIYRSRNEVTDISSNFNTGIPERNSPLYHESEYRLSARSSRISATATVHPDDVTKIQAQVYVDFQAAAPTSNSVQTNGYVPRLREAWVTYDRSDWGFEVLAGQAFSVLAQNKVGIAETQINAPVTIDTNYLPGFTYTRQPQLRLAKSFDHNKFWFEVAAENPQTSYTSTTIPSSLGTLNVSNPGAGGLATGSNSLTAVGNFTDDIAPDLTTKFTADWPMAHFEALGLGRVFHDRLSQLGTGESNTTFGYGLGGGALIHIIPKVLDFQIEGLAGQGIGRYGPAQLPDATVNAEGKPVALPEWMALAGLIGHPTPSLDVYGYMGTEQISSRYFDNTVKGKTTAYGYGNPLYSNTGCLTELAPASTCTANTSAIVQGTVGAWYKFVRGPYGTAQIGAQYEYTHRDVFQGVGQTPHTDENTVLLTFRYYPFQ